jgi:phenylpropionate dioxygenase-like ring-hydroxylating dioxygenase large terminal subunit
MRALRSIRLLLLLALIPISVLAHHSPAMIYDMSREVTISGTVTEFNLGNPHLRIYFDVVKDGATEKWMAEGGSRTVLLRSGWSETEVAPGERISVRGHPSRDGSNVVHLQYLILPDGSEKFGEDLDRSTLERLRRER